MAYESGEIPLESMFFLLFSDPATVRQSDKPAASEAMYGFQFKTDHVGHSSWLPAQRATCSGRCRRHQCAMHDNVEARSKWQSPMFTSLTVGHCCSRYRHRHSHRGCRVSHVDTSIWREVQ